jgi:hypothetical protein
LAQRWGAWMDNLEGITKEVDELIATLKSIQESGNSLDVINFRDLIDRKMAELLELYKQNDMGIVFRRCNNY